MVNSRIIETNTYKKAVYSVSVELPKEVHEVFSHLINLKNWWPEDFEGNDIHLNSEFILRSGDSHYSKNKVIEFVPDKKWVWITMDSIRKTDNFEWTGTKMIFELEPRGSDLKGQYENLNDEFVIHHYGAHYSKQKLVEFIPEKKVVWLVTDSTLNWLKKDQQEWTNTRMIFDISAKGDKTILHFTHEGLTPDKECYTMCQQGWNLVIKDYLFNLVVYNKPHF